MNKKQAVFISVFRKCIIFIWSLQQLLNCSFQTNLIFMGASNDIKEQVYVALVDDSEAFQQCYLT